MTVTSGDLADGPSGLPRRAPRRLRLRSIVTFGLAASALLTACADGADRSGSPAATSAVSSRTVPERSDTGADAPPPGVTVVAELGYPRDLLERGRVNLVATHDSDTSFVVFTKRLVADFYDSAPAEERRTIIPPNGQRVALQTLFGTVSNCDDPATVRAVVELTYTYGDDPALRRSAVPLNDATVLDTIRARECAARQVIADHRIEFEEPVVVGEAIEVVLTLTRVRGSAVLAIDAIQGTVLFGAATGTPAGSPERTLAADADQLVVPLTFVVNRCDPHAIAETTKKYGLGFWIAIDGAEAQRIEIPVDPLLGAFETILERCIARSP